MAQLTLGSQLLFLKDLFENKEKQALVHQTKMWALYEEPLRNCYTDILALPPALTDTGRPLAEQLGSTDKRHDGWGLFVHRIAEAYRDHPEPEDEFARIADAVSESVVAAPKELRAAYPTEALKAIERQPKLHELKPLLQKIPLAGKRAKNLYEAVERFTEHGVELHDLLSARGAAEVPEGTRKDAMAIRSRTQGLITEARGALATEVKHHKKKPLPDQIEAKVFGYADVLLKAQEEREAAAARAAKGEAPAEAPPAPVAGG